MSTWFDKFYMKLKNCTSDADKHACGLQKANMLFWWLDMKQLKIMNCILFQENSDNNDLLRLFLLLFFSYRTEAQWASQGPRTESKWQRPTEKSTDGEKTVREREEWDNSWMHKERQMKKKRICCGRSVRGGSHGEDEEWGRSAVGSHVPTRETSGNLICCHSQCLPPPRHWRECACVAERVR